MLFLRTAPFCWVFLMAYSISELGHQAAAQTYCSSLSGTVTAGCSEKVYTVPNVYPTSSTGIRNPERGFYVYTETKTSYWTPLTNWELESFLNSGYTLLFRYFVLDSFVTSNISSAILGKMRNDFTTIRNAGMKAVLRLCYSVDANVVKDAKPLQLQKHIQQLKPIFQENADVIAVVQAGFIGIWGEWSETYNYGNNGVISTTNWEKRRQVVNQLLDAVPTSRQIQLRIPNYKRTILYRTTPVTSSEAFSTNKVARIGHHNDCFLATPTDAGTYLDKAVEYPYLQNDTIYTSQGGETCHPNSPRSDCPTALKEMSELHYTYLNINYHQDVLQSWKTQGCFDQVNASLGYRFVGVKSRFPTQVGRGSSSTVGVRIKNMGWAAPINNRSAQIVLRHISTNTELRSPIQTNINLRSLLPGEHDLSLTLSVPSSAATGLYKVYLKLPDGATTLQNIAAYNIIMENLMDTANPTLRLNLLGSLTVV